jgi:hypothetical protein
MKEKIAKPTTEEKQLATEMQTPIARAPRTTQGEDAPVQRVNTFAQLAKMSTSASLIFGGTSQWLQPARLFNEQYEGGQVSVPFYITRAFKYKSKSGFGQRLGIEVVLSNGKMFLVSLGLNDNDSVRTKILGIFQNPAAPPVGPFVLCLLPTNKGNDYYDLQPADQAVYKAADLDVPYVEIKDDEIPF